MPHKLQPLVTEMTLDTLRQTPLHALHVEHGARMVPFAGYEMPLHYPTGIVAEHLLTRRSAAFFDVSHMGQLRVVSSNGPAAAASALERLLPIDAVGLMQGRQCYGLLLGDNGGIVDDLMVARTDTSFAIVVNAANKEIDLALFRARLPADVTVTELPHALFALQGPAAVAVLAPLAPEVSEMTFLDARSITMCGTPCLVTRSGYTGEDGFEISVPIHAAETIARTILDDERVGLAGLGARDILRLEAGLCLHGADIDAATTPIEAGLGWAIAPTRRRGGVRAGTFPGAERILAQMDDGVWCRRVGLRGIERTPIRAKALLFPDADAERPVGTVTSGSFSPSLQAPVAMGYVPTSLGMAGTKLFAEVRGRRLEVEVTPLPFVSSRVKRGGIQALSERGCNAQIH